MEIKDIVGLEELDIVLSDNTVVLVDFWAPWCGPCKALAPILTRVAEETDTLICKVDVDNEDNKVFIEHFGLKSVPTLIWFKDGNKRGVTGAMKEEEIIEEINNLKEDDSAV